MSKTTPAISVLMPVFNAASVLPRAVRSVLGQDFRDLELVVVDDGSTDDSGTILEQARQRDDRVRPIHTDHGGITAALNAGLHACRAPLVCRMDADDECLPIRLTLQKRWLDVHPGHGLVSGRVRFGGTPVTSRGYALHVDWTNGILSEEEISLSRFVESPFPHPSVMFRRNLVKRHGGYREGQFPEDYELWLRWMDAGVRMGKVPEEVLVWYDSPERLSRSDTRYSFHAFYRCKAVYLARWLTRHNSHHPDVLVWGAGRETRKRAEHLVEHGVRIKAYIDIDPRKIGQTIHGRAVLGENQIPAPEDAFVLSYVGSRGAREDILQRLRTRGFVPGRNCLPAA